MDWNKEIKADDVIRVIKKYPIAVFGIILLIVVIVIVSVAVSLKKPAKPVNAAAAPKGVLAEALPQTERQSQEGTELSFDRNPFQSDVLANAYITGVMSLQGGPKTAIIVSDYGSFIVRANDKVGKSEWLVKEINDENVIVQNGDASVVLKFKEDED